MADNDIYAGPAGTELGVQQLCQMGTQIFLPPQHGKSERKKKKSRSGGHVSNRQDRDTQLARGNGVPAGGKTLFSVPCGCILSYAEVENTVGY